MIRAEWTKFRTVRGWVLGAVAALVLIIGLGVVPGTGGSCDASCRLPRGPEGHEVADRAEFVHRTLTGDGTITARITSFTGTKFTGPGRNDVALVPWAKAGLIVRDGTDPGSSYAAVMLTGAHGVRMQYDYVHDAAGGSDGAAPRWLRLTRAGPVVTTAESTDGTHWRTVGEATPAHLPESVEIGLFTTSPQWAEKMHETFGVNAVRGGPSTATAVFADVRVEGATGAWRAEDLGGPGGADEIPDDGPEPGAAVRDGVYTVTGSGDIAPAVSGPNGLGTTVTTTLLGTFAGLVLLVVLGGLFVTAEYRRGLIGVTFAASPRRGRVFGAKALVIGAVAAVIGSVAATVALAAGPPVLRANGAYVSAVTLGTQARLVIGTALLLAGCAVLALAVGALVRRSAVALTAVLSVTVLPYLLAMSVLPSGAADWVLRVTPAAAFAVQQSAVEYAHVENLYTAPNGYFPLPPFAGLAVLGVWVAVAAGCAVVVLRRRDVA